MTDGPTGLVSDDLVTCLCKAVCADQRPVRVVTFSRVPIKSLLAHAFGPASVVNLIEQGGEVAGLAQLDPGAFAILARFLDAGVFQRFVAQYSDWLGATMGVILHCPVSDQQLADLAVLGLSRVRRLAAVGGLATIVERNHEPMAPREPEPPPTRPAMTRLVVVDPCLGAASGHYLAYARALAEGARTLGVAVVWAGHVGMDVHLAPPGVVIRSCFTRSFFDIDADAVGRIDLGPEMEVAWRELLDAFDEDGTHFLVHSADAHQLRAIANVVEAVPERRSVIHICCQASPRFMPGRIAGEETHRTLFRLRSSEPWDRSVFLWSETQRLGAWLSQWLEASVPTLPFLSTSSFAASEAGPPGGSRQAGVAMSFLGEARPAKGFHDLPALMDQIAASPRLRAAVRVVIQAWRPQRGAPAAFQETVDRLSRHAFVEIVEGVLTPDDYRQRLLETDVVLLPYDPETYGLQGSGILVDGLARGAVVIVRAGNAVEDEGEQGVVRTYDTPQSFAAVLIDVIDDWTRLSERLRDQSEEFRRTNTADRYVAALDARARGQAALRGSSLSRFSRYHS